jgi:hypothetical protein
MYRSAHPVAKQGGTRRVNGADELRKRGEQEISGAMLSKVASKS